MKKTKYLLLVLFLSITLIPMVFAKDEVKIESYKLVKQSDYTDELSKPKINGLNISFDLSFGKEKDYAKYQIVVTNPTNKDYELNKGTDFKTSKYISYSYDFENNNSIVKANSKLTMYITITYDHAVPASELKDGRYIEDNKVTISLSNTENPETSINISIMSIIILAIIGLFITLYLITKKKRYLNILLVLLTLPIVTYAIEKIYITVTTKITIEEKYKVSYYYETAVKASEEATKCLQITAFRSNRGVMVPSYYIIDGEKYTICTVSLDYIYRAGEKVIVSEVPYTGISRYNNATGDDDLCTIDDNNNYNCPKEAFYNDTYKYMEYSKDYNPLYKDEDISTLNIKDIGYNNWVEDGYIEFQTPNEFIMPKHDMIIQAIIPPK